MSVAWIVDAVRTPIGRHGGALAGIRPDDLAAHVVGRLVARSPDLDPAAIDDVWFGDANGAGEDNRDVARMAVLLAGLPSSVPGVTVNRLCGSGMEALVEAGRADPGRSRPRSGQPQRRGVGAGAPARRVRGSDRCHAGLGAPPPGRRLGPRRHVHRGRPGHRRRGRSRLKEDRR